MDSTLDRLRRLQKLRPQKALSPSAPPSVPPLPIPVQTERPTVYPPSTLLTGRPRRLETLVPGEEVETDYGPVYVVTQRFALDERRGELTAGDLLAHSPAGLAALHPQFNLLAEHSFADAAFIDTETTGLGGGAGIYAFMVGVGTYETPEIGDWKLKIREPVSNLQSPISNRHFVVRQLFMRNPAEEPAMLLVLAHILEGKQLTVTFNGRGFDLPLLRTRYFSNRGLVEDGDMPLVLEKDGAHLDLLMPARRLWKRRLQSCRLINLEAQILGLQRTGEDVPGHLIPQLYVDYVNSNDARAISGVFYHNHEDVMTMVGIATELYRVAAPASTPAQASAPAITPTIIPALDGRDWLSLGQMYELQAQWQAAEDAYRNAIEHLQEVEHLADLFQRLGALYKRLERWQEATEVWERWLTTVPKGVAGGRIGVDASPYIELAKYHEWQSRDLEQAEMWVQWALHTIRAAPSHYRIPGQLADLEHRLARIQRKRQ